MKKILTSAIVALALPLMAAVYSEQPLINGWNIFVTNGTPAITGNSNILYTYIHGEVFNSLNNNNGNTNSYAPESIDSTGVPVYANANGDIVANAAIHYYLGNTNWIPQVLTNSQGQLYVSSTWPLNTAQYPANMYPATTNVYPRIDASGTSTATFNFQRGWSANGAAGAPIIWDSVTNLFTFGVATAGTTPVSGSTNLPTAFLQGATYIRLHSISLSASNTIVNQISVGQWKP